MSESDAAYGLLCDLEQTLTGVRGRLADLALLASGAGPPGAGPRGAGPPPVVVDVLADVACTPELPEPLVLPPDVPAPAVVLPETAGARERDEVSAR